MKRLLLLFLLIFGYLNTADLYAATEIRKNSNFVTTKNVEAKRSKTTRNKASFFDKIRQHKKVKRNHFKFKKWKKQTYQRVKISERIAVISAWLAMLLPFFALFLNMLALLFYIAIFFTLLAFVLSLIQKLSGNNSARIKFAFKVSSTILIVYLSLFLIFFLYIYLVIARAEP